MLIAPSLSLGRLLPSPRRHPTQLLHIGQLACELVNNGDRVGLGSGRAALAFVRALGERVAAGLKVRRLPLADPRRVCAVLKMRFTPLRPLAAKVVGVPTSLATEAVAREVGIPLATLETVEALDIAVDGADEVCHRQDIL
jgi:ribose 5-phosphate isomerase A